MMARARPRVQVAGSGYDHAMHPAPTLVALDLGTSVARAAVWRAGEQVAEARRPLSLHFPSPGRAEQDPRELAEASSQVLAEACGILRPGERAILGIANQRSTIVLWDAETGRPFGPALSWRDSRASDDAGEISARVRDVAERTGLPATPHYGAPKIRWALRHWPEARKAAQAGRLRVGPVSTWICFHLSRGDAFAVDPTNAQRLLLMSLGRLEWDADLLRATGVPASALPQIRPTDGAFGTVRAGRTSLPVMAMMGDQQAALAGLGATGAETALVQLGTGGFVMRDTGSEARFTPGLLAGLARADANRPRRYLVEGPVSSAGSALDRLRDLGILRADDDLDALVASSRHPAIVVPAWAGLAAPWWTAGARAALMGWDESTTRADIVAGTVRGIAFLVADILDFMTASGLRVRSLQLSGPLARVPSVAQAIADACGLPGIVRVEQETTLAGIATVLAEATGAIPPRLPSGEPRRVEPRPEAREIAAARAAFATARAAAIRLARDTA